MECLLADEGEVVVTETSVLEEVHVGHGTGDNNGRNRNATAVQRATQDLARLEDQVQWQQQLLYKHQQQQRRPSPSRSESGHYRNGMETVATRARVSGMGPIQQQQHKAPSAKFDPISFLTGHCSLVEAVERGPPRLNSNNNNSNSNNTSNSNSNSNNNPHSFSSTPISPSTPRSSFGLMNTLSFSHSLSLSPPPAASVPQSPTHTVTVPTTTTSATVMIDVEQATDRVSDPRTSPSPTVMMTNRTRAPRASPMSPVLSATVLSKDDDDDDDEFCDETELSWRLPPHKSWSDCIIHVRVRGSTTMHATYHVHKSVLAVGPKRSFFFAASFLTKPNANVTESTPVSSAAAIANEEGTFFQQYFSQRQAPYKQLRPTSGRYKAMMKQHQGSSSTLTDATTMLEEDHMLHLQETSMDVMSMTTPLSCSDAAAGGSWNAASSTTGLYASSSDCHMWMHHVIDPSTCTIQLELEDLAASIFPTLLDYCYAKPVRDWRQQQQDQHQQGDDLAICTDNATALDALSVKLEMKLLKRRARSFWMKDLVDGHDRVFTYYRHARRLKHARILAYAAVHVARHLFEWPQAVLMDLLETVDPLFFLRVISSPALGRPTLSSSSSTSNENRNAVVDKDKPETEPYPTAHYLEAVEEKKESHDGYGAAPIEPNGTNPALTPQTISCSLRLSLLVAVYCNVHKDELSMTIFQKLTDAAHMPVLEIKAAKALLDIEDEIGRSNNAFSPAVLTSLKRRCIQVLSENWIETCCVHNKDGISPGNDKGSAPPIASVERANIPKLVGEPLEYYASLSLQSANRKLEQQANRLEAMEHDSALRLQKAQQDASTWQHRFHVLQDDYAAMKKKLVQQKLDIDRLQQVAQQVHAEKGTAPSKLPSVRHERKLTRPRSAQRGPAQEWKRTWSSPRTDEASNHSQTLDDVPVNVLDTTASIFNSPHHIAIKKLQQSKAHPGAWMEDYELTDSQDPEGLSLDYQLEGEGSAGEYHDDCRDGFTSPVGFAQIGSNFSPVQHDIQEDTVDAPLDEAAERDESKNTVITPSNHFQSRVEELKHMLHLRRTKISDARKVADMTQTESQEAAPMAFIFESSINSYDSFETPTNHVDGVEFDQHKGMLDDGSSKVESVVGTDIVMSPMTSIPDHVESENEDPLDHKATTSHVDNESRMEPEEDEQGLSPNEMVKLDADEGCTVTNSVESDTASVLSDQDSRTAEPLMANEQSMDSFDEKPALDSPLTESMDHESSMEAHHLTRIDEVDEVEQKTPEDDKGSEPSQSRHDCTNNDSEGLTIGLEPTEIDQGSIRKMMSDISEDGDSLQHESFNELKHIGSFEIIACKSSEDEDVNDYKLLPSLKPPSSEPSRSSSNEEYANAGDSNLADAIASIEKQQIANAAALDESALSDVIEMSDPNPEPSKSLATPRKTLRTALEWRLQRYAAVAAGANTLSSSSVASSVASSSSSPLPMCMPKE